MSLRTTLLGQTRLAHLAGVTAPPSPNQARGDDDGDDMDARLAEATQRAEDAERRASEAATRAEEAEARAAAAEEEVRRLSAASDPDGDGDDDSSDEGDDDGDREDMVSGRRGSIARARLRERGRCAAIFGSPAAGRLPTLAAELAFAADGPGRAAALRMLSAAASSAGGGLAARMAATPVPPAGGDAPPAAANQLDPAESVLALYNSLRGIK